MLDSGKKQSCHLKMVSKKGTEFYIQMEGITVSPIPNQPLQFDIAIMDITQRVKAEQNLLKTKERLQLALEASAVVTWELEPETMQFYFDELNYRVSTIPGENFDGKYQTFINLVHREDREIVDQHFRTSLNNQTKIDVSCRYINNGGNVCYISIRGHIITGTGQPRRFVGIMMDITEKRRKQKTIALATSLAEENERKRISDALHDSVSQLLYGIRIKLGSLDAGAHKDVVGHINGLLDLAIHETRNISFELAPSILTDFGLPATIDELAKRLSTPQMQISTRITGFDERLEKQLEIGIFRIIQELVNNCMKHAGASLIFIEIVKSKSIAICVKDNGQGYHPANLNGIPSGSGLSSIKNRISFYNGQLRISSNQGSGTKVDISLEYQTDHEPAFNNNL
jgi:PAS domain S-box-containing protein